MNRLNSPGVKVLSKNITLIILFCIIGFVLMLLTAGDPITNLSQSTPLATIQSATPGLTKAATPPPDEVDVTNGLILAGALLILVIITGTLHATWGLRKSAGKWK